MSTDDIQELLDGEGYGDWTVENDAVIICPCGEGIEWDGACSDCGSSPFVKLGLI